MKTYKFQDFAYVDGPIVIPKDTVFYRGVHDTIPKEKILRDYPIYLGSNEVAKKYGKVYTFKTIKELRLLDIRKMTNMLPMIIDDEYDMNDTDVLNQIQYLIMGLGINSYKVQFSLLSSLTQNSLSKLTPDKKDIKQQMIDCMVRMQNSPRLKSPMDISRGVRIGEITINGHVVSILKEMFSGICDGYIAPKLQSPYHSEGYVHDEVVVFSPTDKLELLSENTKVSEEKIDKLLAGFVDYHINYKKIRTTIKIGGTVGELYDRNLFFLDTRQAKKAIKEAKRFVRSIKKSRKQISAIATEPTHNMRLYD